MQDQLVVGPPEPLSFPDSFDTERLTLRAPRPGDGAAVNAAIVESHPELIPWFAWATPRPSAADTEANLHEAAELFAARKVLRLLMFLRGTDTFVGSTGLHHIDWVSRSFEIGYWMRTSLTGRGLMTEAVLGQVTFARHWLGARTIFIGADNRNERSWRVAERAGFHLTGVERTDSFTGKPGRLYSLEA